MARNDNGSRKRIFTILPQHRCTNTKRLMRYSLLSLIREGLRGHRGWQPAWRDAAPKDAYEVHIIGGGGHCFATAYYLAKQHGIPRVAVLEKNHIGSGNAGRN